MEEADRSTHQMRVDRRARELIAQHGARALFVAIERINESIDRSNRAARDFWAEVVHAIHEYQQDSGQARQAEQECSGKETDCTDDMSSGGDDSG